MTGDSKANKFLSSLYQNENVLQKGRRAEAQDWVPTFSPSLNWALGGGIPTGHLIQFAGAPSSGKTLVSLLCASAWQKKFKDKAIILFADFEHSFSLGRAKQLGVEAEPERLIVWKEQNCDGAKFFDWLNETFLPGCIETGLKPYIILDSKDNMVPPKELERTSGQMEMGAMATFLKRVLKKSVGRLSECGGTMVIINQLVLKIGQLYGDPNTTSGGMALKHNSSIDVWFKAVKGDDEEIKDVAGEIVGHKVTFKIPKNKLSSPFRKGEFRILYNGKTTDRHLEVLEMAKNLGVVGRPTNRSWEVDDKRIFGSRIEFETELKNNSKLCDELIARCSEYEKWAEKFKSTRQDSDEEEGEE